MKRQVSTELVTDSSPSVEDKRDDFDPVGDRRISNFRDQAVTEGVCGVYGPGFSEQLPGLFDRNIAPLN